MTKHTINVCAGIVTYNPDPDLPTRISTFANHVAGIVIVDNHSNESEITILRRLSESMGIHLIENPANFGVATGFNQAAEWAINNKYDWILTMDQEDSFDEDMIYAYFKCFHSLNEKERIAVISPGHRAVCRNSSDTPPSCDFDEIDAVMTPGNLVNLGLFRKVGSFDDKLFIDEVDHEYCLRAKLKGYKIIQFRDITVHNKIGHPISVRWKGRSKIISVHSPERLYYITRNHLYMWKKYNKQFPEVIRAGRRHWLKKARNELLFADQKGRRIYNVFRGAISFIFGRYGRY